MINEAILVGHVGKKDSKVSKDGTSITVISLATKRKYVNSQGEKQENTTWHHVNCFAKLAEIAAQYVHVGDLIYVRGTINNKKIESGEKAGQYIYSVTAADIKFLRSANKSNNSQSKDDDYEPIPF